MSNIACLVLIPRFMFLGQRSLRAGIRDSPAFRVVAKIIPEHGARYGSRDAASMTGVSATAATEITG